MSTSRRSFLKTAALLGGAPALSRFQAMAAPVQGKVKITDVKVMVLQGPRTYTLIKVLSDSGLYGIGEGYGSPGVGVKEGVLELRENFLGKDPLDIEPLYVNPPFRTDGSAHMLLRAMSGIEMAVWDLAGKILGVPVATLLGGKFRTRVRMYHDEGPRNMLDKASCRDWAARMKASPAGWTAFKIAGPRSGPPPVGARGSSGAPAPGGPPPRMQRARPNRLYSRKELTEIQQGFENCREAIGWDYDLMFHGQWDYDLVSAIQLSQALESSKPLWIEDPMPPDFSNAWVELTRLSKVPILTGENLARRQGFADFILQKGLHIAQLDVRNTGGLLESKKIADLADMNLIPMCAHDSGSVVNNYATLQWACAVRDFLAAETMIGRGDWMDDVVVHDGPIFKDGYMTLPDKPGLGIELNPDVVKAHLAAGETYWG